VILTGWTVLMKSVHLIPKLKIMILHNEEKSK
jgi:hypothetical protein